MEFEKFVLEDISLIRWAWNIFWESRREFRYLRTAMYSCYILHIDTVPWYNGVNTSLFSTVQVDRHLRKLDQELAKFKMELEADNAGITEILEQSKWWCMRSQTTGVLLAPQSLKILQVYVMRKMMISTEAVWLKVSLFLYTRLVDYVYVMVRLLKGT